jgi:hypothetical protein
LIAHNEKKVAFLPKQGSYIMSIPKDAVLHRKRIKEEIADKPQSEQQTNGN